jgi:Ca2+-binding EF-hand superfamily protein
VRTEDERSPASGECALNVAPRFALLIALALGAAVAPATGWATPREYGEVQADAAPQALLLPRSAIAAAARRTAVADPDLDGEVTIVEAARYYETRFSLLDEDRNGSIDGPEFVRAAAVRSLYAVDSFAQPQPLAFESVDVDGNGVLTPEEFLRADLLRRSASVAGGLDGRRRALFEVADVDRDRRLSQQEFVAAGRQDFLGSDANGDGEVSIWEFYGATRL